MIKTVKRSISLMLAMVFAVTMLAVPSVFAGVTDLGTEGWKVALYSDADCTKPIQGLVAGQEAYVQFSLLNIRFINAINVTLTATGMTFQDSTIAWDYTDANSALENGAAKLAPSTNGTDNAISAGATSVIVALLKNTGAGNVAFAAGEETTNKAFKLTGATETAGVELKLATFKVKVNSDYAGEAKITTTLSSAIIGGTQGGGTKKSPIDTYNNCNDLNETYPTVVTEAPNAPALGKGDADTPVTGAINTPSTVNPLTSGGYKFLVKYSNSNEAVEYPVSLKPATLTTAGAYVDAAETIFALTNPDATADELKAASDVVIYDPLYGGTVATLTGAIQFNIQATQYRIKADTVIELPRGIAKVEGKDVIKNYVKKSSDGWVTEEAATADDITATEMTFKVGEDAFTNMAEVGSEPTAVTAVIGDMKLDPAALKVKTIAPIETGVYTIDSAKEYVVYYATLKADTVGITGAIDILAALSDGTTAAQTTTDYTISADAWTAFYNAAKAHFEGTEGAEGAEGTPGSDEDFSYDLAVTDKEEDDKTLTAGNIKVVAKAAEPTGNYRLVALDEAAVINYKGAVDPAYVVVEAEYDKDVSAENEGDLFWEVFDLTGYTVAITGYDNTVAGEYDAVVAIADGEGNAMTLPKNTLPVAVEIAPTYSAAWANADENGIYTVGAGTADADIISNIAVSATYTTLGKDGNAYGTPVVELADAEVTIAKAAVAEGETAYTDDVTVTKGTDEIGELKLKVDESVITVTETVAVDDAVVMAGTSTGAVTVAVEDGATVNLTYAITGTGEVTISGNVATDLVAAEYAGELVIPGYKPVAVTLAKTAEATTLAVAEDAVLVPGWVAVAAADEVKTAVGDLDFIAVAANLGADISANPNKAKYDFDHDGAITMIDLEAVATVIADAE